MPFEASAQDVALTFEHIGHEEGLSHGVVYHVFQDQTGFIWFAGEGGLNRYDGYHFITYQNDPLDENSLSNNDTGHIIQDENGYLWVTTWGGGINRFDPRTNTFTALKTDPQNEASLSDNRVQYVFQSRDGTIWLGTYRGGLNRLNPKTGVFTRYQHNPEDPTSLSHNRVWCVIEDKAGILWIGTDNGLNRFDPQTEIFTHYHHDPNDPTSVSHNRVQWLFIDSQENFWVSTRGGFNRFDPQTGTFTRYLHDPENPQSLSHNSTYKIHEDRYGRLWVATNGGGLCLFNRETGTFTAYQHDPNNPHSISHNDIRSITSDNANVLWIGTRGGGINKVDLKPKKFQTYTYNPNDANTLRHASVTAFAEDAAGNLWVGTDGGGLSRLDAQRTTFQHFQHDAANVTTLSSNRIAALHVDQRGILWASAYRQGLHRYDPTSQTFTRYMHDPTDDQSLNNNQIYTIVDGWEDELWLGTDEGLTRLDWIHEKPVFTPYQHDPNNPNSPSHTSILSIYIDSDQQMWLGTWGGGLNRVTRTGTGHLTFLHYRHDASNDQSLSNDDVFAIHQDRAGNLWVGTRGGLNRLAASDRQKTEPQTVSFRRYLKKDGLPSNEILSILEDSRGNLWLSTSNGVCKFNPLTETFRNYDTADGLQSNEFTAGASFVDHAGFFYLGGINGFNRFKPAQVKDNPHIPPVVITGFRKFDQDVQFDRAIHQIDHIQLSYKENFFSFEFAALDYTNPAKNQYRYKLEGFDKDWINAGKMRFASYTNVHGGNYTFRVIGSNNDGVWNETGASIQIRVTPPPWKTWWAYTVYVLTVLALIGGYVRWKTIAQTRELERQRRELQHKQLVAERLAEANKQLQEADRLKTEANEILRRANIRLEILLNSTRQMAEARQPIEAIIKAVNAMLHEIPIQPEQVAVEVTVAATGDRLAEPYLRYSLPVTVDAEGLPHLPNEIPSRYTPLNRLEPPPPTTKTECYLHPENQLVVVIYANQQFLAQIQINGVDGDQFTDAELDFIETIAHSLAVSLENISFSQELEAKVNDRTQQLLESERLATLAGMAGMIAHEINNALSGINGPVEHILKLSPLDTDKIWECWEHDQEGNELSAYLEQRLKELEKVQSAAQLIQLAGVRTRTVVQDLQGLVGKRSLKRGSVDVGEVCRETIRIHQQQLEHITLREQYGENLNIISTSGQLGQIFTNLLNNAVHAVEGAEQPTIEISIQPQTSETSGADGINGVEIRFRDNGYGIPEDVRKKMFEPFFTTKGEKGRGLGMSIILRIVKEHQGTIQVESEIGQGTTFIIWLPHEVKYG